MNPVNGLFRTVSVERRSIEKMQTVRD